MRTPFLLMMIKGTGDEDDDSNDNCTDRLIEFEVHVTLRKGTRFGVAAKCLRYSVATRG